MTIVQHTFTSNYTVIGNACFNDARLSFEALAIFTYRFASTEARALRCQTIRRRRNSVRLIRGHLSMLRPQRAMRTTGQS
ncbi:hypothetical protein ABIF38_005723 [Bradyrhizobium japonicum]|uniref:hypothetical protein n=1 Tax=Bradyrhizobium elkanii TaxID=29448 RepID=UPI00102224E0|nr:hypothetical protein [Bradyrhizobium elkanii]MCS4003992.1 hypothetical protein [Bradyrhizobium elkanii USDA 61]MBP2434797.1 hypothetical protein [Bradyrhizobium elkanii]MCP1731967.1 hypothetical protein [Bradyrhizobium elkanii]MCP1932766.1 hypothetical protein [Bradyrhizobium elkanii]MCS3479221.1 hypothetical protein [Bradyrhizobium elkanii]